jgi:hypothetical protein
MKFIAAIFANVSRKMKKKFSTCDYPSDYSKENKTTLSKKKKKNLNNALEQEHSLRHGQVTTKKWK